MTARLLGASDVRSLLDAHAIRPSKRRGQNFVTDPNTVRRVVAVAAVGESDRVLEIGTGVGSLTVGLVAAGCRVLGVEVDPRCASATRDAIARTDADAARPDAFDLVEADATTIDWAALLGAHGAVGPENDWVLVANLPYSVGTTILLDVLDTAPMVVRGTVMLQQEVGERLVAGPGDAAFGAVSVKAACRATLQVAARVPPTVFTPRPAVDSVLVTFLRHRTVVVDVDCARIDAVVDAGFAQRRKTLRRALGAVWSADDVAAACAVADVDTSRRAESLTLDEFASLAAALPPLDAARGRAR